MGVTPSGAAFPFSPWVMFPLSRHGDIMQILHTLACVYHTKIPGSGHKQYILCMVYGIILYIVYIVIPCLFQTIRKTVVSRIVAIICHGLSWFYIRIYAYTNRKQAFPSIYLHIMVRYPLL